MIKRVLVCAWILISVALAVTLNNDLAPLTHIVPPPTNYSFYPWSPCYQLGAQGVFSNGSTFGSGNAAVWPVGPHAFVSALHINDFRRQGSEGARWEKIRYLGTDYLIQDIYVVASDTVLYSVVGTLPQWHSIWRGPYTQNNVSCFPGTSICFTNQITTVLTNMEFMAVLPGPLGNIVCGVDMGLGQVTAWAYGTNYLFPSGEKTVQLGPIEWSRFQTDWIANGFIGTQPLLYGGNVSIYFAFTSTANPELIPYSNFGARLGDSGGGLFVRERGANVGVWKLVGMVNNGGYCKNNAVEFSVIDLALGFNQQYWDIVGEPANGPIYSAFRTNLIATGYQYSNCAAIGPIVPSVDPPPPPPPPPPPTPQPPTVFISLPLDGSTNVSIPVAISATASDVDGSISEVRFYEGGTNLISIDSTAPYSIFWSPTNGTYVLSAVARDNNNQETTSTNTTVTIAVPAPNIPPTIFISTPTNLTTIDATPTNIVATASDSDGSISEVRFYANSILLSISTNAPYTNTWSPTNGSYALYAIARDNTGQETTSTNISITVAVAPPPPPPPPPTNSPPSVAITGPANGSTISVIPITISASAVDVDGTVTEVRFYDNGVLLGIDTLAAFSQSWTPTNGLHALTAIARDSAGLETTSPTVNVNVSVIAPNAPPIVFMTFPTTGSTFTVPLITIGVIAADIDGSISEVRVYDNGTLVSIDHTSPYQFAWSPTNGVHSLTAVARDNQGLETMSSPVSVTINVPSPIPPPDPPILLPAGSDFDALLDHANRISTRLASIEKVFKRMSVFFTIPPNGIMLATNVATNSTTGFGH